MSENNQLQKRLPSAIKEKGQYALALVVIASMLVVTNIPVFVIFFFGIFAYFVIRMFSTGPRNETREIFEFYLSANEILRDDDRRWYGFEIQETIERGEDILQRMSAAPPLVRFTLGALYNKFGDHKAAVSHLAPVIENPSSEELAYVYPTPELRNYVKVLRKIEREPAEAPLTSASIRALERARKLRGRAILEESRAAYLQATANNIPRQALPENGTSATPIEVTVEPASHGNTQTVIDRLNEPAEPSPQPPVHLEPRPRREGPKKEKKDPFADRKPITEVLHDIYDKNVQ